MRAIFKRIIFYVSFGVLAIVCCTALLALMGFRPFILRSSSMEPLYREGSLIWVDTRIRADEAEIGDVLVYRANDGTLVMHRLVDINTFQGDANQTQEHIELTDVNLVGRVTGLMIPHI